LTAHRLPAVTSADILETSQETRREMFSKALTSNYEMISNTIITIVINNYFVSLIMCHVVRHNATLLLNRKLVSRAKLRLISVTGLDPAQPQVRHKSQIC